MRKIWANSLLSDGEILFWHTGNERKEPHEFYKDFYDSHINMVEYEKTHKLEIAKMMFIEQNSDDNSLIFNVLAPDFYKNYKISHDSKGAKPYYYLSDMTEVNVCNKCHICCNATVNPELTSDNDLSYIGVGKTEKGYGICIRSGNAKPTALIVSKWEENLGHNVDVGIYNMKFCPECGRRLIENTNA